MVKVVPENLHKGPPVSALTKSKRGASGRNSNGRTTMRYRGGGHKQRYRVIDFKRDKDAVAATVERLEYDPNRGARIALLLFVDGERRYIIAPKGLRAGDKVESGANAPIRPGNAKPLAGMPIGVAVHCVEMKPGKGGQLARAAGCSAQFVALDGDYALLRMRSGEVRKIPAACRATLGEVGNGEHFLRKFGKAGAKRWRGIRPHVRGNGQKPRRSPDGRRRRAQQIEQNAAKPVGAAVQGLPHPSRQETLRQVDCRFAPRAQRQALSRCPVPSKKDSWSTII